MVAKAGGEFVWRVERGVNPIRKEPKQVAKITYTNQRPIDFWETRGYDWYAGL